MTTDQYTQSLRYATHGVDRLGHAHRLSQQQDHYNLPTTNAASHVEWQHQTSHHESTLGLRDAKRSKPTHIFGGYVPDVFPRQPTYEEASAMFPPASLSQVSRLPANNPRRSLTFTAEDSQGNEVVGARPRRRPRHRHTRRINNLKPTVQQVVNVNVQLPEEDKIPAGTSTMRHISPGAAQDHPPFGERPFAVPEAGQPGLWRPGLTSDIAHIDMPHWEPVVPALDTHFLMARFEDNDDRQRRVQSPAAHHSTSGQPAAGPQVGVVPAVRRLLDINTTVDSPPKPPVGSPAKPEQPPLPDDVCPPMVAVFTTSSPETLSENSQLLSKAEETIYRLQEQCASIKRDASASLENNRLLQDQNTLMKTHIEWNLSTTKFMTEHSTLLSNQKNNTAENNIKDLQTQVGITNALLATNLAGYQTLQHDNYELRAANADLKSQLVAANASCAEMKMKMMSMNRKPPPR
jgi:hypothetical protein